jgi:hypothetical protein
VNPDKAPEEPASDPSVPVVKSDLRAAQQHVESAMKRGLGLNYVTTGASIIAAAFAVYFTIMREAKAQTDAGIAVSEANQAKETNQLKVDVGVLKVKTDLVESAVQRQEQKMDKLLEVLRIPNPAPAPKDAGR